LDLKGFDYLRHDGLVLDNVNSVGQFQHWQAVLQARNAKSKGGQSATNVCARRSVSNACANEAKRRGATQPAFPGGVDLGLALRRY